MYCKIKGFWESRDDEQILLLLSGDKDALEAAKSMDDGSWSWLSEGDLVRGHFPLEPKSVMVYSGTMDNLISAFSARGNLEDNCKLLQGLLKDWVCEFNPATGDFECYTCGVVVMPCCVGQYLKIVNRKEV